MQKTIFRRLTALLLCLALLVPAGAIPSFAEGETRAAIVNGDNVNVRSGPGTNNGIVATLSYGHALTVTGEGVASQSPGTPNLWYPVTFQSGMATLSGYMYSDYVLFKTEGQEEPPEVTPNLNFEEQLARFPDSYKEGIVALHAAHPSWSFEAVYTNLDWNYVQEQENVFKRSLINWGPASYRSTAPGCYNWETDTYIVLEGRNWYQAAPAVVAYYMDPRNFLNEADIFQFEKLSYDPGLQTREGVVAMLAGSFMDGVTIYDLDNNPILYADTFIRGASEYGVALYHLVARCLQEIGRDGKAAGTRGNYPGYEGIYNYYSIGAATGAEDGLRYAAQTDPSTYRPWNTPYRSIMGGAQFLSDGYISAGQDTLYFQKFSVVGSKLFWHQYMASIGSPNGEGHTVRASYARLGLLDTSFTFRIPVFNNMPIVPCAMPPQTGSPNSYLSSLSVAGYELTPAFSPMETLEYSLVLPEGVNTVTVSATAFSSAAVVS
ncbi:MAG: SH3 domain-containing protein, partial [Clostridia bacterium]|nr:SH3 domain-containing protein [Clostridia bacterium]